MHIINSYIIRFKQTQPMYTKPTTKYEYIIANCNRVVWFSSLKKIYMKKKKKKKNIYIYIYKLYSNVSRCHCFKNRIVPASSTSWTGNGHQSTLVKSSNLSNPIKTSQNWSKFWLNQEPGLKPFLWRFWFLKPCTSYIHI